MSTGTWSAWYEVQGYREIIVITSTCHNSNSHSNNNSHSSIDVDQYIAVASEHKVNTEHKVITWFGFKQKHMFWSEAGDQFEQGEHDNPRVLKTSSPQLAAYLFLQQH